MRVSRPIPIHLHWYGFMSPLTEQEITRMLESTCCFECGKPIDVTNELYRTMDAYHEKDNPATMPITAHEHCIVGSPNEKNWRHAQWGLQAVRGFIEMKRFQSSMHKIQRVAGHSQEQMR